MSMEFLVGTGALTRGEMRRDFCDPDRCLDSLHLAEEGSHAAKLVMSPVLEQACGLWRHLPLAGRQSTPGVDLVADLVDDRGQVVSLTLRRQSLAFVEHQLLLAAPAPLLRLGKSA